MSSNASRRVHPTDGIPNGAFELGSFEPQIRTFDRLATVGYGATRWENMSRRRRLPPSRMQQQHMDSTLSNKTFLGCLEMGSEEDVDNTRTTPPQINGGLKTQERTKKEIIRLNRNMIAHFVKLQDSNKEDDEIDFEYLEDLIEKGADINCADKYGQTLLHEVASSWNIDVAIFFIEHGANINSADFLGRTPLHVAAATNYPEMVEILVARGAEIEAKTKGENQTAIHFAARNDAVEALKVLKKLGGDIESRDYKLRTPLHIAAELDRSETARYLVENGADVFVRDENGQACMTFMITKMGPVARDALDNFHKKDRANRKQYFYLNHLEPNATAVTLRKIMKYDTMKDPEQQEVVEKNLAKTPLQVIVHYKQLDLIMHPVILRLIDLKYDRFGRRGAIQQLLINLVYIIIWTVLAVATPWMSRYQYEFPQDAWRVCLWIVALLFMLYFIFAESLEIRRSKVQFKAWKKWKEKEISRDIDFCHPKWPEEKNYLTREKELFEDMVPQYFNDFWNLFDWTVYFLNVMVLLTHVVDIALPTSSRNSPCCQRGVDCQTTEAKIAAGNLTDFQACALPDSYVNNASLSAWNNRIFVLNIIMLWFRLMKNTRTFRTLGPFVVMLGKMTWDIARFFYLYMEFYIPYACAFWMIFGNQVSISSMSTVDQMLFSLYRITLVDDYQYDEMHSFDIVMAYILIGTFLGFSAILCINLFIALLSDTFQRVYDNAKSNAVMQQAILILSIEDYFSKHKSNKHRRYIQNRCNPLDEYYDDDLTTNDDENLKKVTFQIKDQIEELLEIVREEQKTNRNLELDLLKEADILRRNSTLSRESVFLSQGRQNLESENQLRPNSSSNQLSPGGANVHRAMLIKEGTRGTATILEALAKLQASHASEQSKLQAEVREMRKMLRYVLREIDGDRQKKKEQGKVFSSIPHPQFPLQSMSIPVVSRQSIHHSVSVPVGMNQPVNVETQDSAESFRNQLREDVRVKIDPPTPAVATRTRATKSNDFEMTVLPGFINDSERSSSPSEVVRVRTAGVTRDDTET